MSRDEEPVGFLDGASGSDVEDPYGTPGGDDEVVGYLEGSEAEGDELPALPPQETETQTDYSARDFIEEPTEEAAEDPYADPYADYEGYDPSAVVADADPSYFDSMGHGDGATYAEEEYPTEDYGDDDQPKTISQQDAESIIRRITTKRIQPADTEAPRPVAQPSLTTTSSGGGRMSGFLIIFGTILALGAMAMAFPAVRLPVAAWIHDQGYPEVAAALGYEPPPPDVTEDPGPQRTADEIRADKFREMVLKSERIAFGAAEGDVRDLAPAAPTNPDQPQAPGGAR